MTLLCYSQEIISDVRVQAGGKEKAVLSVIAKNWEQPRCPSVDKVVKQMVVCSYSVNTTQQ